MTADITKIKVINVMKDGTILESMKGVVPPAETGVYEVIARIARKRAAERDRDRAESIESGNRGESK